MDSFMDTVAEPSAWTNGTSAPRNAIAVVGGQATQEAVGGGGGGGATQTPHNDNGGLQPANYTMRQFQASFPSSFFPGTAAPASSIDDSSIVHSQYSSSPAMNRPLPRSSLTHSRLIEKDTSTNWPFGQMTGLDAHLTGRSGGGRTINGGRMERFGPSPVFPLTVFEHSKAKSDDELMSTMEKDNATIKEAGKYSLVDGPTGDRTTATFGVPAKQMMPPAFGRSDFTQPNTWFQGALASDKTKPFYGETTGIAKNDELAAHTATGFGTSTVSGMSVEPLASAADAGKKGPAVADQSSVLGSYDDMKPPIEKKFVEKFNANIEVPASSAHFSHPFPPPSVYLGPDDPSVMAGMTNQLNQSLSAEFTTHSSKRLDNDSTNTHSAGSSNEITFADPSSGLPVAAVGDMTKTDETIKSSEMRAMARAKHSTRAAHASKSGERSRTDTGTANTWSMGTRDATTVFAGSRAAFAEPKDMNGTSYVADFGNGAVFAMDIGGTTCSSSSRSDHDADAQSMAIFTDGLKNAATNYTKCQLMGAGRLVAIHTALLTHAKEAVFEEEHICLEGVFRLYDYAGMSCVRETRGNDERIVLSEENAEQMLDAAYWDFVYLAKLPDCVVKLGNAKIMYMTFCYANFWFHPGKYFKATGRWKNRSEKQKEALVRAIEDRHLRQRPLLLQNSSNDPPTAPSHYPDFAGLSLGPFPNTAWAPPRNTTHDHDHFVTINHYSHYSTPPTSERAAAADNAALAAINATNAALQRDVMIFKFEKMFTPSTFPGRWIYSIFKKFRPEVVVPKRLKKPELVKHLIQKLMDHGIAPSDVVSDKYSPPPTEDMIVTLLRQKGADMDDGEGA